MRFITPAAVIWYVIFLAARHHPLPRRAVLVDMIHAADAMLLYYFIRAFRLFAIFRQMAFAALRLLALLSPELSLYFR